MFVSFLSNQIIVLNCSFDTISWQIKFLFYDKRANLVRNNQIFFRIIGCLRLHSPLETWMTFIIFQQLASLLTAVPLVYDRNFLCDSFDRCTFSLSWKCFIWQLRPFVFDVNFLCDSLGSCAFLSLFEMSFRQLCHHCSHFLDLGLVSGFQWLHLRGGFPKNEKN